MTWRERSMNNHFPKKICINEVDYFEIQKKRILLYFHYITNINSANLV